MKKSVQLQSFELIARDIAEVDINLLHGLSMGVRWPHRPKDWEVQLQSGKGIVAVDGIGRVFGSAMWFPYGDDLATIGMVITSPRTQAQGTGRWLMDQVLERCGNINFSLNSTKEAYNLYVSLGFATEATVYQCQGEVALSLPEVPETSGELVALSEADLAEVIALDASAFGTTRGPLLQLLAPTAAMFGLRRHGKLVGYAFCREFGRGKVIGPIIADNDQDAIRLTAAHLQKLKGEFVRVDTREKDGAFADYLARCRLLEFGTVTTMSKGRRFLNRTEGSAWVYGLAAHGWS